MRNHHRIPVLFALISSPFQAQVTRSILDGVQPPAMAPGAAAGSYLLSGIESLNHFSGGLSLSIPLLEVGGRGEAKYTIRPSLETKWSVDTVALAGGSNAYYANGGAGWDSYLVGYGPGYLAEDLEEQQVFCANTILTVITATRLRWRTIEGNSIDLYDRATNGSGANTGVSCGGNGQPQGQPNYFNRGREFVARDGSGITYQADQDVRDLAYSGQRVGSFSGSGSYARALLAGTAISNIQTWRLELIVKDFAIPATRAVIWQSGSYSLELIPQGGPGQFKFIFSDAGSGGGTLTLQESLNTSSTNSWYIRVQRRPKPSQPSLAEYSMKVWNASLLGAPTVAGVESPAGWTMSQSMTGRNFSGPFTLGSAENLVSWTLQGSLDFVRLYSTENNSDEAPAYQRSGAELLSYEFNGNGNDSGPNGWHLALNGVNLGIPKPSSGMLYFANGNRIRVFEGRPEWMADRHGNLLRFFSEGDVYGRITRVLDSLGREIRFEYATNSSHPSEDHIVFPGTAPRTLKLKYQLLSAVLRDPTWSVRKVKELFPQLLNSDPVINDVVFNPFVPSEIELPNSQKYLFRYNQFAELARVELPTGGRLEYEWDLFMYPYIPIERMIYRRVKERRTYPITGVLESRTLYSIPLSPSSSDLVVTVEEHGSGQQAIRKTVHTFHGDPRSSAFLLPFEFPHWNEGREYRTDIQDGSGVLFRREEQDWRLRNPANNQSYLPPTTPRFRINDPRITERRSTLGGVTAKVTMEYSLDEFNNVTRQCEFDYGAVTATRCTRTDYETAGAYTSLPVHLRGLVKLQTIETPNGTGFVEEARSAFVFDDYGAGVGSALAAGCPSSDNPGLVNRSPISGFDSSRGTGFRCRGNVTREEHGSGSALAITRREYDIAGNVVKVIRPEVVTGPLVADRVTPETTVSYADSHSIGTPTVATYAYPTTINHPLGLVTRAKFHYALGTLTEFTDPNNATTTYTYGSGDALDRLTGIGYPIGAMTFQYVPLTNQVITRKSRDTAVSIVSTKTVDGFGREIRAIIDESYGGADTQVVRETQYDQLGRMYRVSNPARGAPSQWTATAFDVLDRPLTVTHPDGSVARFAYLNNETLIRDPAGKWAKRIADGLGRLSAVIEDPSGTIGAFTNGGSVLSYSTVYTYDGRNLLKAVNQGGRDRSFEYDALGRLRRAVFPEFGAETAPNGIMEYAYDAAGNVTSRQDPRGASAAMYYDALGRMKKKIYSGVTTPQVAYCYDGDQTGDCAGAPAGANLNLKGRLTRVKNSASTSDVLEYDPLGRILRSLQTTAGLAALSPFVYTYDHVALESMTYPSGRRITNAYDRAGRIVSVTGVAAGVTKSYVSGVSYAPHGALEQVALGANGVRKERSCYNERLQMTGMILGESPAANCGSAANTWFRIGNSFPAGANNGNIQSQEIADQGSWLAIQTFTYDKLDRLEVATEGTTAAGWKQTFGYDRWGNRWLDPDPVKTYPASANGVANGMSWFTAKNRLNIAGGFDLAGNQLYANPFVLSYDAENRLAQAASSTEPLQNRSYGYDGEGRRVTEVVGTAANQRKTFYVYNAFGELAAEYEQVTGSPAPRPAAFCATCYLTADHLGSTRVIWDENGVKARFDYHPFGELISGDRSGRAGVAGYNAGGFLSQKFTGKERDAETGLDYFGARYMSPGQGRFVNPDAPFADQDEEDPQSWNLFAYVANNPLAFIDSNGRGKSKAVVAVIKRLQVGFEQIVVRNEGKNLGRKEAMDRVKQQGDDVIFDSNSAARAAAGGRGAKKHGAHTNTAGPNALPHYHPTNSSGKKGSAHAFIRKGGKILIPGAALGTAFFGDNLFGQTVDLVNPMSDVQEGATLMDEMIVPSIFGFVDKYLMNPPKPKPQERELLPKVEVRICFDDGGCRPSKW